MTDDNHEATTNDEKAISDAQTKSVHTEDPAATVTMSGDAEIGDADTGGGLRNRGPAANVAPLNTDLPVPPAKGDAAQPNGYINTSTPATCNTPAATPMTGATPVAAKTPGLGALKGMSGLKAGSKWNLVRDRKTAAIGELKLKEERDKQLLQACIAGDLTTVIKLFGEGRGNYVNPKLSAIDPKDGWTPIYRAVYHRRFDLFCWLLDRVDLRVRNRDNSTPLHAACDRGGLEYVHRLMATGQYANDMLRRGTEATKALPVHYAAMRNDALVIALVCKGVVNKEMSDGTTPLYLAASNGCLPVVSALLDADAFIDTCKNNGATPLHAAAFRSQVMVVKCLIQCNGNPNVKRGKLGNTPLHFVASQGTMPTMTALFKGNCDVDVQNNDGATPVMLACQETKPRSVAALIAQKADINIGSVDGRKPIHMAVHLGDVNTVAAVLAAPNIDLDAYYKDATPLMMASQKGLLEIVTLLVEAKAKLDHRVDMKYTALHLAVGGNHLECARKMLEHGADATAEREDGNTTLHFAAKVGNRDMILAVIRHGGDRASQNDAGESVKDHAKDEATRNFLIRLDCYAAMQSAARCGELPELVKGLKRPEWDEPGCVDDRLGGTPTLLYAAAVHNHDVIVKYLIERGADVNVVMEDDTTALFSAAEAGCGHVVKTLLEAKANPYAMTPDGPNPAYAAADKNKLRVLKNMHAAGVDLTRLYKGLSPLHNAVVKDYKDIVKFLAANSDCNVVSSDGSTPLLLAAGKDSMESIRILVKTPECDPNIARDDGTTPLHMAAQKGNYDALTWLLGHGADPNIQKKSGSTPLHNAAQSPVPKVMEALLKSGANPNVAKEDGTTPLIVACRFGMESLVRLLIQANADPDVIRTGGNCALHAAVVHPACVSFLLDGNANMEIKRDDGSTPLSLAISMGVTESVRLLMVRGARVTTYTAPGYSPQESLLRLAAITANPSIVSTLLLNGLSKQIGLWPGETSYDISKSANVVAMLTFADRPPPAAKVQPAIESQPTPTPAHAPQEQQTEKIATPAAVGVGDKPPSPAPSLETTALPMSSPTPTQPDVEKPTAVTSGKLPTYAPLQVAADTEFETPEAAHVEPIDPEKKATGAQDVTAILSGAKRSSIHGIGENDAPSSAVSGLFGVSTHAARVGSPDSHSSDSSDDDEGRGERLANVLNAKKKLAMSPTPVAVEHDVRVTPPSAEAKSNTPPADPDPEADHEADSKGVAPNDTPSRRVKFADASEGQNDGTTEK